MLNKARGKAAGLIRLLRNLNCCCLLYLYQPLKYHTMKKLVLLFIIFQIATLVQAQSIQFGVKAGLNQGSLSKNPNNDASKSTTGLVAGVFFRAKAAGLYIQPELLFSQRRGVFGDTAGRTTTTTLSYIDFPVLVGFKVLAFRINAGPNFQFLAGASQSGSGNRDANFSKNNFNNAVVGFQAGIGADLGPFQIDVRYDGSIGNLGKSIVNSSGQKIDYSTRSNMYQITLGYRIFKT